MAAVWSASARWYATMRANAPATRPSSSRPGRVATSSTRPSASASASRASELALRESGRTTNHSSTSTATMAPPADTRIEKNARDTAAFTASSETPSYRMAIASPRLLCTIA